MIVGSRLACDHGWVFKNAVVACQFPSLQALDDPDFWVIRTGVFDNRWSVILLKTRNPRLSIMINR